LDKSAIILAGGFSSRFGQDKGLLQLAEKPIIRHILDVVDTIVDESIIIVSSKSQAEKYSHVMDSRINVFIDEEDAHGPLMGALTGFKRACGRYSLLLPCDTPFLSKDALSLLLELCINRNAVIPRWPNGYIEPLQAVYRTKPACEAAKNALSEGRLNVRSMVDRLRGVRYVSTLALQELDPEFRTFFNINTPMDLKRAELMLKRKEK